MGYRSDIYKVASLDLPWEQLSGCNILITGASGLIGSCLIEVLMAREHKDYCIYASGRNEARARKRFEEYANDPAFHFFKYDVIKPLEGNVRFDYIIHAASNASPNFFASKPVEVIKSNINGVSNLFDYGMQHGLRRLLFVSTGEVYGEGDGRAFTEEYSGYVNPVLSRSCYPASKRAAETLCVSYGVEYGVETVIARPCHVFGPNISESDNRVYAQFIRNVLNDEDIVMKSTGSQFRSWCYVVDCASALLYIMLKGKNGEAYNIADQESNISIRQLAELVAEIGGKVVVVDIPSNVEKADFNPVTKSVFSTRKLESLGWCVSEGNIKTKLSSTINSYLDERNKYRRT